MMQDAVDREPGTHPLRVCYVQAYRAPDYIRGRSLRAALAQAGDITVVTSANRAPGLGRYWQAIRALLRARQESDPQVYLLGFRGHEIAWLVRWLTRGKPLVFDALMSPYASLAEERKHGPTGRLVAPLWRRYERWCLQSADAVLTDTRLHADYYVAEFGLPRDKVVALPVGADEPETALTPTAVPVPSGTFRVLFYGSFLSLHGMDVIRDAVARLTDLPIEFICIGGTRRQSRSFLKACESRNLQNCLHRRWVPFERLLGQEIPAADLCLGGPFGGTPQARRVVTGKTSQCLALGKATVIGRIDEDYGFIDRENCLLVDQGDAGALAAAIRWAYGHREVLPMIGQRGQSLYAERLSTKVIADRLLPLMRQLASHCSEATA